MDPLWSEICWSNFIYFKYFILLIVSTNYVYVCVHVRACACVCVRARACVCVCVSVCVQMLDKLFRSSMMHDTSMKLLFLLADLYAALRTNRSFHLKHLQKWDPSIWSTHKSGSNRCQTPLDVSQFSTLPPDRSRCHFAIRHWFQPLRDVGTGLELGASLPSASRHAGYVHVADK